jgi:hypothetical protein
MVVHISPGHTSGTLVNALLHHCGLGPLEVPSGSQAPVGLTDQLPPQQGAQPPSGGVCVGGCVRGAGGGRGGCCATPGPM